MNSVVIGSGFGGIAAALRLKAKGHNVTLVEKHHDLGGRARVFKKNGFIYDGGPTVITAPYLINEIFELFKKDPKNYIELSPLKIWYQFIFEDKTKFNYSGDENEMNKFNIIADEKIVSDVGVFLDCLVGSKITSDIDEWISHCKATRAQEKLVLQKHRDQKEYTSSYCFIESLCEKTPEKTPSIFIPG